MKRSSKVVLGAGFLVAAGIVIYANSDSDPDYQQVCLDRETEVRVADDQCPPGSTSHGWYYIPYHTPAPAMGGRAIGGIGSYTKPGGSGITAPVRGGFGKFSSGGG